MRLILILSLLALLGQAQVGQERVADVDLPARIVVDGEFAYRLRAPHDDTSAVRLEWIALADPSQRHDVPMPGLADVQFYGNPIPWTVTDGILTYYSITDAGGLRLLNGGIVVTAPETLRSYDEVHDKKLLRSSPPTERVSGTTFIHKAHDMILSGGDESLHFDAVMEEPRLFLVFSQYKGTLEVERVDARSDDILKRSSRTIAEVAGDLAAPFHMFQQKGIVYILEANGDVNVFEEDNIKKIGELPKLKDGDARLSGSHILLVDQSAEELMVLDRRSLAPLRYVADDAESASPFGTVVDERMRTVLTAILETEPSIP